MSIRKDISQQGALTKSHDPAQAEFRGRVEVRGVQVTRFTVLRFRIWGFNNVER